VICFSRISFNNTNLITLKRIVDGIAAKSPSGGNGV
jgi:hypothetical protein